MRLLLKNGFLVDPSQNLSEVLDLLTVDGLVAALGHNLQSKSDQQIDASGRLVVPGLIDLHVHLREPGREDVETIETGAKAAAAGGFTSICCMPNTQPINDCAAVTTYIRSRASQVNVVNVWPVGAITRASEGRELADFAEMMAAGAVAFSDDGKPVPEAQLMRRALQYAAQLGMPIIDHCQDRSLSARGAMHEGAVSAMLGIPGIPASAEESHVARDILLAEETGGQIHIAHISTRRGVEMVRAAKARGVRVTAEATPHHLFLTESAVLGFDTNFKMNPPLRTEDDRQALIQGLADGTIDILATDHAPHHLDEKLGEFDRAPFGVIGLETAIPLVLDRLVNPGLIDLSRFVQLASTSPASLVRKERGTLKQGAVADVTVLDPDLQQTFDANRFRSKSRNTPFDGWQVRGGVSYTIVAGEVVYDRSQNQ
ncbi:MAG: dihydroorotase [Acidobacteria bacterium]|nr:dihydroorotase [Acidobacteriota bacterium]